MSDVGLPAGNRPAGPTRAQLNPEQAPALIAKWRKLLGKEIETLEVSYNADGVTVNVTPIQGAPGDDGEQSPISIAAFKAAKAEEGKPSAEQAKVAFRNKFELRLNIPFPDDGDLGDGSDAAIQRFLQGRPFAHRRAMLMSNKQFKAAYPNGYGAA